MTYSLKCAIIHFDKLPRVTNDDLFIQPIVATSEDGSLEFAPSFIYAGERHTLINFRVNPKSISYDVAIERKNKIETVLVVLTSSEVVDMLNSSSL